MRELRRTWICNADGRDLPVLLKRVTPKELAVHRLIADELPNAVPPLDGVWPSSTDDSECLIAIRDLRRERQLVLGGAELLRAGVRTLAAVHDRFVGRAGQLRAAGVAEPPALAEPFELVGESLARVNCHENWSISTEDLDDYVKLEPAIAEERSLLANEWEWTLVHNDFHLENIFAAQGEAALILDWESACLQVPAWDLVACSKEAVAEYLAGSHAGGDPSFARLLQAAALVRMQWLLRFLLRSTEVPEEARASAARACMRRVLDAGRPRLTLELMR
jgi:hypothetical protein